MQVAVFEFDRSTGALTTRFQPHRKGDRSVRPNQTAPPLEDPWRNCRPGEDEQLESQEIVRHQNTLCGGAMNQCAWCRSHRAAQRVGRPCPPRTCDTKKCMAQLAR